MSEILNECPIWHRPCIKEDCAGYEVHTKQRFYNLKTGKYIPIDQLGFYSLMTEEQKQETLERRITIVRECRQLGKIIEIENKTDHLIPSL